MASGDSRFQRFTSWKHRKHSRRLSPGDFSVCNPPDYSRNRNDSILNKKHVLTRMSGPCEHEMIYFSFDRGSNENKTIRDDAMRKLKLTLNV